jgi:hypothetical protein
MYFIQITDTGWSAPQYLTQSIHASATLDNTVYVNSGRTIVGNHNFGQVIDLYGAFPFDVGHSCIAPDGTYLIFDNSELRRSGNCRLFVVFKEKSNSWSDPVSLGEYIPQDAFCAWITHDGEYIFFHSQDNRKGNIYWVSAEIIDRLRAEQDF